MIPSEQSRMKITGAVFVILGLGLLAGGAAWYYYQVHLPQSWPRADATVVSSRVINPGNPNQHKPELVLRLERASGKSQVTVTPSWSSGSYAIVKAHVDRYPAESHVEVAVNPADADDVRYELGATLGNMLGPLILGVMGLLFSGVGVWSLRSREESGPRAPAENARLLGRVVVIFRAIGVVIVALGLWMAWLDVSMLRTWVPVEAEAVAARIVTSSSSGTRRPSGPLYDVQVTFRYEVDDKRFESQTTSGMSTSSTSRRDALLKAFASGTHHRIHHNPDDPNVIRYNLDWSFRTFVMPIGMIGMGSIFLGFSWLFTRRQG